MGTPTPRIRGNAIQQGAHWTWELFITIGPEKDGVDPLVMSPKDGTALFLTKDAALNDLRKHASEVMKLICAVAGLPEPATLIDLVQNEHIGIDEFAKPKKAGEP